MQVYYDEKLKDYIVSAGIPDWKITEVVANDDYTLLLTFVNGEKKIFDCKFIATLILCSYFLSSI